MSDAQRFITDAQIRRPTLRRSPTSEHPLVPVGLASASAVDLADNGSYFPQTAEPADARRRQSSVGVILDSLRRPSIARALNNTFNPDPEAMVEPFSFVSEKVSAWPSINITLGLVGQLGYSLGPAILERQLVMIPSPIGVNPGVGTPRPDDVPDWHAPSVAAGIAFTSLGLMFGLASSLLFLRDGLRIAGNRNKALSYFSMHLAGIVLIALSRTIIDYRKNATPLQHLIALTIPASLGRGIHWVTIPRSFSNSEVARQADFARLSFEQRLMMSEGLRVTAALFFGLWAGSWSIKNYNPLVREVYAIAGSLTLNMSAALPNTNLRRADMFRRSNTSAFSPQLSSFRLGSPPGVSALPSTRPNLHSRISEQSVPVRSPK